MITYTYMKSYASIKSKKVKLSQSLNKQAKHMKVYVEVDVLIHVFLAPAQVASGQFEALATLQPEKVPLVPIGKEAGWALELV
jgi:hypothetical protein